MEIFKGVGSWTETSEEGSIPEGNPRVNNQKTFSVKKQAKGVTIPREYFDDDLHSTYNMMVRNMARRAKTTRDKNAMALYNGAFATYKTADSSYIVAADHENLNGDTVDNKLTAALAPSALKTAIQMLYEQKAQDGEIDGHLANTLLVPPALYDYACEVGKSELKADTAENNMNPYSNIYNLWIFTSPYLGAAAGGSDTAWFLMSDTHSVTRWVRKAVSTHLRDWTASDNETYLYQGSFREMTGAPSYEGLVGSTGAA